MQLFLFGLLACAPTDCPTEDGWSASVPDPLTAFAPGGRVPSGGLDAMPHPAFTVEHFGGDGDATANLHVQDLDRDGIWDVVSANGEHNLGVNTVFSTGEDGILQSEARLSERFEPSFDVLLQYVDDDDVVDLIEINDVGTPSRICYAEHCDEYGESWHSRDTAVGDFDGDGRMDVVILNKRGTDAIVWGHAPGVVERFGPEDVGDTSVIAVDLDGDQWLDLVVTARDGETARTHRTGPNGIQPGTPLPLDVQTRAVTARDIDFDGDLDLFFAVIDAPNLLLLNDGTGGFDEPIEICPHHHRTWAIAAGDLDGDGRLDVVEGHIFEPDTVHYGLGGGRFTDGRPLGDDDVTKAVRVVDLDADGDMDVVAGHYRTKNTVYLNNRVQ